MPTPLLLESTDYGFDLAAIGASSSEPIRIVSPSVPAPTLVNGWPDESFADSQEVHYGVWGHLRVLYDGKDVTEDRTGAIVEDYQLTEPYGYGPAHLSLPQSPFEASSSDPEAPTARLVHVDADGNVVRTMWEGFTTLRNPTLTGLAVQCDGKASGRLAQRIRKPALFRITSHLGRKIYDAFNYCGLRITPYLGGDVGDVVDGRGLTGSYQDYVDGLLAGTIQTDGSQYTVMPTDTGSWELVLKDTTTVDFTMHLGANGVEIDIQDDITERPNVYYGQGISPDGLIWVNGKYPGLIQGSPPPYPFDDDRDFGSGTTDEDTDTGDGITILVRKLVSMGYLPRTKTPGGYDNDVTKAIKALQRDSGNSVTGDVDTDTWDALYDISSTGYSKLGASMAPLAQDPRTMRWFRTSNGSPKRLNPGYVPSIEPRDFYLDYGPNCEQSDARDNALGMLQRSLTAKNWSGTITLTSDVFAGEHTHGDDSPTLMSRLDIRAGMNGLLRNFDGDTLFHVSAVQVDLEEGTVQLGVDTQARDYATLAQVIERRMESRERPARQWFHQHRTGAMTQKVQGTVDFGQVFNTVDCPGNQWTVFVVLAGDTGSVSRVRLQTSNSQAAFALAVTALKTSGTFWDNKIPNPLQGGQVTAIFVNDGGSGYTSAPTVTVAGAATARATVSGGKVISVEVKNHGSDYGAPPAVSFSGGGGSGATATASLEIAHLWTASKMIRTVDDERALLAAWGSPMQPCGYFPAELTNSKEQATGAPVTGLFMEDVGFDYHTSGDPLLYLAIYPDRDCKIRPQRVLWETAETDA